MCQQALDSRRTRILAVFGWLEHRNADWMSRLVGFLFCEDEVVHVLTMDEARRIASNARADPARRITKKQANYFL
jgi:hypothetical protein